MTAGFNCELTLAGVEAHHSRKNVAKLNRLTFMHFMCIDPDVQAGFRKGRGTRDEIASIPWIIEKAREFQKNIYFCFIAYAKAFDCVDHNKLWKILTRPRGCSGLGEPRPALPSF